jgi:hypothetical protein
VTASLDESDLHRIERVLGWRPTSWRPAASGRGHSASAARWLVAERSRRAFVKIGATPVTARLFRREHLNYATIAAPMMPRLLGFFDDGDRPALAIEDLSDAVWPPPWRPGQVDAVLAALDVLHGVDPPGHLERVAGDGGRDWQAVGEDPSRWAALGLCSTAWLERSVPGLLAAAAAAPLAGDALVHLDVRSDNVCFRGTDMTLIDWPEAAVANPDLDVAFWLPSLASEDGSLPEATLPDAPELAAWVAGYFFSRAALPPIPDAPYVRPLQLAQSSTALPWAARALGLPPP